MLDVLLSAHRCRIEEATYTKDASGGTVETFATVADQVSCLVGLSGSGRDGRFDGLGDTATGTVSSLDARLATIAVGRVYFHDGPAAGRYGYADGVTEHTAHPLGLVPARWTARWSTAKAGGV